MEDSLSIGMIYLLLNPYHLLKSWFRQSDHFYKRISLHFIANGG